jgi:hypothetical protein
MNHVDAARIPDQHGDGGGRNFADLVDSGIRALDALLDYVGAILKLQGYRIARTTVRSFLISLAVYASAGALALAGLVLLTFGFVFWVAARLESLAAGFFVVGGSYALVGAAVAGYSVWRTKRSAEVAHGQR